MTGPLIWGPLAGILYFLQALTVVSVSYPQHREIQTEPDIHLEQVCIELVMLGRQQFTYRR